MRTKPSRIHEELGLSTARTEDVETRWRVQRPHEGRRRRPGVTRDSTTRKRDSDRGLRDGLLFKNTRARVGPGRWSCVARCREAIVACGPCVGPSCRLSVARCTRVVVACGSPSVAWGARCGTWCVCSAGMCVIGN